MASITISRHVEAPPDRVFRVASDFAGAPGRIRGIKKVELLTSGPVRVGTRFKETRVVFKREATETMEVTAFDPPRGYALGCDSCGCRYRSELRFTPSGAGTDVELTFEARPLTFFAKVMSVLMRPMIKMVATEAAKDLDDLKSVAEQGATGSAAAS